MFIGEPVPDPDFDKGPVFALGLVTAHFSPNINLDRSADVVRKFIADQGWLRPPTSMIRPLHDVVMIGLEEAAPLNEILLDAFHSRAHVLVVPSIEHLPDRGEVVSSVINIATVDDGRLLRVRDRNLRLRRTAEDAGLSSPADMD